MPELPEVESYRRYLEGRCLDRAIAAVPHLDASVVRHAEPEALAAQLVGSRITGTHRHGKLLFAALSRGGAAVFHFGMTGRLQTHRRGDAPRHARLVLDFSVGDSMAYVCQRKFGYLSLTDDPAEFVRQRNWGPDALDELDEATFVAALAGTRSPVKAVLMDQSRFAGIGNLYADEVLFQARIRPSTPAQRIGPRRVRRLFRAIATVLQTAVERNADFDAYPAGFLLTGRAADAPCPRCGKGLSGTKVGGRTTVFCRNCQ